MSKLWVDPPEGWKYGFPAIYDPETDGQISDWAVRKGYPLLTIKEYGEQWHVRCWSAEEPKECPDEVINTQEQPKAVENDPIGASREQLIAEVAVLTELVRVLNRRLVLSGLEGKEPSTCPICNATAYPYPKCGCVYYKEKNT
jgi:hypothetical protein